MFDFWFQLTRCLGVPEILRKNKKHPRMLIKLVVYEGFWEVIFALASEFA